MARFDEWKADVHDGLVNDFGEKRVKRMKIVVWLLVIALSLGAVFTLFPFRVAKKVVVNTVTAENIVYNYQWFYDQYQSIQAQKANLHVVPVDSVEYRGMKQVLNRNIAEYNSRASQITRNVWKSGDLPYSLTMEE